MGKLPGYAPHPFCRPAPTQRIVEMTGHRMFKIGLSFAAAVGAMLALFFWARPYFLVSLIVLAALVEFGLGRYRRSETDEGSLEAFCAKDREAEREKFQDRSNRTPVEGPGAPSALRAIAPLDRPEPGEKARRALLAGRRSPLRKPRRSMRA